MLSYPVMPQISLAFDISDHLDRYLNTPCWSFFPQMPAQIGKKKQYPKNDAKNQPTIAKFAAWHSTIGANDAGLAGDVRMDPCC